MQGTPLQVYIAYRGKENWFLTQELKLKYLSSLNEGEGENITVEFLTLGDLFEKHGIQLDKAAEERKIVRIDMLNKLLSMIQTTKTTLLFIDEIRIQISDQDDGSFLQDCRYFSKVQNIDFFFGLSPWFDSIIAGRKQFEVTPPIDNQILSRHLIGRHRNPSDILGLCNHTRLGQLTSLNPDKDEIEWDALPEGEVTLWIVCDEKDLEGEILNFIDEHYIRDGQSVTIITDPDIDTHILKTWCQELSGKRNARVCGKLEITGCEDDVVILWNIVPDLEVMTRAKERLITVTIRG